MIRTSTYRVLVPFLLLGAAPAHSADVAAGKALHDARCVSCHDSGAYTRPDRRIDSLAALDERVRFCESANRTGWSDRDIDNVIAYLNQTYYKFPGR